MPKIVCYEYKCDICNITFKNKSDVLTINGSIDDGDGNELIEDNGDTIYCKNCLIKILKKNEESIKNVIRDDKNEKIETTEENSEERELVVLRMILNEKDEEEFLSYLGYTSIENFRKIYDKSLINYCYPIEDDENIDRSVQVNDTLKVIHKVFAGIPQIIEINGVGNEKFWFIDKLDYENMINGET